MIARPARLLAAPALLALAGAAAAQDAPARFARVTAADAAVHNLADDKGLVIATPEVGSLVAVHGEHDTGWLLVEVPGGFAVWVFGEFLEPTDAEGVYEVTRNAVNIRPRPSRDVTNFPLAQRLHAGDRVRVIETLEPEKPLAETWARIWSPPGVRAWLRTVATEPLGDGEDGAGLWGIALRATPSAPPVQRAKKEAEVQTAAASASQAEARESLESARELLASEREQSDPDYGPVREAFYAVLRLSPDGPVAAEARAELRLVATLEEAAALQADLEAERERRVREAHAERERVRKASKRKDPLGDVFLSRGVLLRRAGTDGTLRYHLRFGQEVVSEVICPSGRYDLERFAGYEVGVQGTLLGAENEREIPGIEITRLEVIARR